MQYDLIIVGGGPAGSAAAVYAARKRLKTLLLVHEWGGQSVVSEQIYNWIGTPAISGADLAANFKKHVEENTGDALEVKSGEKAINVSKKDTGFVVKTESGNEYETKTLLIASGSGRRKLTAQGADRLEHKGLTYCASCDGPLFSDMDVAVIGGGNAAFETAAQLLAYCSSVTLFNRSEVFRADPITVEKVLANPKMKIVKNAEILEVKGDKFVEAIKYKNVNTGEEAELPVAGIFVEIGQIPNTDFVKDLLALDPIGRVKIDPRTQKTEVSGVWAAGDCTDVLYHQNNIAAGDAVRALEDIYLELNAR
jgi:NADH-dependent peroxiredoxin subunit F